METIVQIAQLLLALSLLVGIHEGGHMLAAKMFGMKVEKFFIGFPPTLFSFKKGETQYGLGAIPLGGFVKISGMIDESMDKEQMKRPPELWEFRSKPAWQRLIVMLGGVIVNVIAGVIAFIILTYNLGETYLPAHYVQENGIVAGPLAEEVGFQTGDKILKVNGQNFDRVSDIWSGETLLNENAYWTVDRNGETIDIPMPKGFINELNDEDFQLNFIYPQYPFAVQRVPDEVDIPLQAGDKIVKIGEKSIAFYNEFQATIGAYAGKEANLVVERDGSEIPMTVKVNADSTIGFYVGSLLTPTNDKYTLGEAIPRGAAKAFSAVILNAKALGSMFDGDVSPRSLSGPIGIVNMFPKTWDWNQFWYTTGFISMILAFMNLLPIPALDGGHVVFLLYEMISGNAPSDAFLEGAQKVGMIILLGLMVFVFGNDIMKLFGI